MVRRSPVQLSQRPQGSALPSITLQVVSGAPDYHMDGRDDLIGKLVQIDIWASQYSSMKPIVRALVAALAPVAHLGTWTLRRGPGGHWRTIRSGDARDDVEEHPVDF